MKSSSNKRTSFRRRVLLGAGLVTLLGCLAATISSCGAVLPDIDEGRCGNRVVEPSNGEYCEEPLGDGDAGLDGAVYGKCGLPGSYAPCRYICNDETSCDPGYGCGFDGICRQSGGLSDLSLSIGGLGAQQLLRGDFDGDGRYEIVAADGNVATVYFLTTEGFVASSRTFPYAGGTPAIGDLNDDGLSDMVLNLGQTMAVWLGQEDRTLIPQTYPLMYASPFTQRLVPLGSYMGDGYVLALSDATQDNGASLIAFGADGSHRRESAVDTNLGSRTIHGAVAVKQIDDNGKNCGVVAAAFQPLEGDVGLSNVLGVKRCEGDKFIMPIWNVNLGSDKPWAGTYFRDIYKDGTDELLYGVDYDFYQSLLIDNIGADGKPVGNPVPYLQHEPGNCISSPAQLASPPLAIADLNADGHVDFVDSRGVLMYDAGAGAKPYNRICHSYSFIDPMDPMKIRVSWTSAVVADFNGDGWQDLIASRKGENILDMWTWKPEGLTTITISVPGQAQDLVTGDLDGDTVSDLVFRIVPPFENALDATPIYAIFGNPLALPSAPQAIGSIRGIKHLVIARLQGANQLGAPDLYDDLLVLADGPSPPDEMPNGMPNEMETGESALTLIQGSPTRTLVAPLFLQENTEADLTFPAGLGALTDRDIHAITISDFGVREAMGGMAPHPGSNIIVATGKKMWTAGYELNGNSVVIKNNLDIGNNSVFLAPVDDLATNAQDPANPFLVRTTKLGVFSGSQKESWLWFINDIGMNQFKDSYDDRDLLIPKVRLPRAGQPKVPYVFADLDANGRMDVVLLVDDSPMDSASNDVPEGRTIVIYWNGDAKIGSPAFDLKEQTVYKFVPADRADDTMDAQAPDAQAPMMPQFPIQDIAAINYDEDEFLELAILAGGGVYVANIDTHDTALKGGKENPLPLFEEGKAVVRVQGGDALLTIDANSDGIDDLVVGDSSKLMLFFGVERQIQ